MRIDEIIIVREGSIVTDVVELLKNAHGVFQYLVRHWAQFPGLD